MFEVYTCEVCGNMIKVVHASGGTMVCCGKTITLQPQKAPDPGKENHVPVVEKSAKGILVKPGSVPHPDGGETLHRMDRGPDQEQRIHQRIITRRKTRSRVLRFRRKLEGPGLLQRARALDKPP